MKKTLRHTLYALSAAAILLISAIAVSRSEAGRSEVTCTDVAVHFQDSYNFVSGEDVKEYLDKYYGTYIGQRIDSVRLYRIEDILDGRSAILKSEAWTDSEGLLHIGITQRKPALRFLKGEGGFYVDDRGCIFPLLEGYEESIMEVSGRIPVEVPPGYKGEARTASERKWLSDMISLNATLEKSRTVSITAMRVTDAGDIELIPEEGRERFIIGCPEDNLTKLGRIDRYYKYIKPAVDEDYYRTVNVKYDGQIICRQ